MRADFELARDFKIVIMAFKEQQQVMVETLSGVDYGNTDPDTTIKTERCLLLTKGEARAIASALMGCAAEL